MLLLNITIFIVYTYTEFFGILSKQKFRSFREILHWIFGTTLINTKIYFDLIWIIHILRTFNELIGSSVKQYKFGYIFFVLVQGLSLTLRHPWI